VSSDLAVKVRLGIDDLATVRDQLSPLIATPPDSKVGVIETAAACAMLHSFYTEIEKILKLIAKGLGEPLPASDAWHINSLRSSQESTRCTGK
jgi:hypothetical protein